MIKNYRCKIYFTIFGAFFKFALQQSFAQATYAISRFDHSFCTTVYPTPYVTGSFSIIELSTANSGQDGFSKNQTSKTLIIDLPSGFEFNTAAASTVTTSGPGAAELTSLSFAFSSVTRITVTLTVENNNDNLNTLDFNNFEIRAMASGSSGNILRTGGTLSIEQSTGNPTAAEPLGILAAATPYVYTGSAVTQPNTSDVTQYSINQEIIRIKISGTGSCGSIVTQFNFSTVGGNSTGTDLATTNITAAKLYYTGSSSVFATTSFFGSFASPDGAFSITGSQSLVTNDSYFWLTYDVPGNANTAVGSNRLDAEMISFVLDGVTKTDMTTPAPAGYRQIIGATYYYSRFSGNWNTANIWSASDNGATCNCEPNGSGVVVIDTSHTVAANVTRTVDVIDIKNGGILNGAGQPLTVNSIVTTSGSGKFTLTATLTVLGNVILSGSGASTNSKIIDINGDLTINTGTSLTGSGGISAGVDQNIYIGGNLTVDGTLQQTGAKDIVFDVGAAFIIAGSGTITTTRNLILNAGSKSVPAGSNLTINSDFSIQGAYTITNNGTINLNGDLDGTNGSAQWINAAGSVLNYAGGGNIFATSGVLNAAAVSNTVNYNSSGNQDIKLPNNSGQYNNLILSIGGTKTLSSSILVSGNWTNNATLDANLQEVTFNGSGAQSINGTSVPTFYELTVNKSAGTLSLGTNATVSNILTFTSGNLDLNSKTLTISNSATTAITRTSGFMISEQTGNLSKLKWNIASVTGSHIFPFGTTGGTYTPLTLNLTAGTIGNVTVSTYSTAANNTPLPSAPTAVANVNDGSGNDNSTNVVDRFWQIDKDGASGTATLTFTATAAEVGTIATLRAQRWGGTDWVTTIAGQSNTATTATVPGVTTFGPWTLYGNNTPLPIELLSFTANAANTFTDIKWTTATEINNDYFTIEKSKDGLEFVPISTVDGAGNSTSVLNYSSVDDNPYENISYYRLKQTDFNGTSSYSNMVAVEFGKTNEFIFNVYPNPSNKGDNINVSITGTQGEEIIVVVYDITGKESYTKLMVVQKEGDNIYAVDDSKKLPSGVYMITATSDQTVYSKKLIVK